MRWIKSSESFSSFVEKRSKFDQEISKRFKEMFPNKDVWFDVDFGVIISEKDENADLSQGAGYDLSFPAIGVYMGENGINILYGNNRKQWDSQMIELKDFDEQTVDSVVNKVKNLSSKLAW